MLDRVDILGRPVKDRKNRPRTILLPDVVLDALAEQVRRWPPTPEGLIFTNKVGKPLRRTIFADM
jgi:hypothetical protein